MSKKNNSLILGVLGHPLQQTLSPLLHAFAMAAGHIGGGYMAWPVRPEDLAAFIEQVRKMPIHGVSVTIPHKKNIIKYVDKISPEARLAEAANTLFWEDGQLVGHNTDIEGFTAPLKKYQRQINKVLLLGSGGAASAALSGLKHLGIGSVVISSRNEASARALAQKFNMETVAWEKRAEGRYDLLINSTPLGLKGALEEESPWPAQENLRAFKLVYDLIYNPKRTKLLEQAEKDGCRAINGLEMFLLQGRAQFRIWTGCDFDLEQAGELLQTFLKHSGH